MGIRILGLLTIVVSIAFISLESELLSLGLTFFLAISIHSFRSNLVDEFSPRHKSAVRYTLDDDSDYLNIRKPDYTHERIHDLSNNMYLDNVYHDHSNDY